MDIGGRIVKLGTKVALVVTALFALYGGTSALIQQYIVMPGFIQLEQDAAGTDMDRVLNTFDREVQQFSLVCEDWGNWIDAYEYVKTPDPQFITDNFNSFTLQTAGIDFTAILDAHSEFLWHVAYDPYTHAERRYAVLDGTALDLGEPFRAAIASGKPARGIVWTELGPALIVLAPILDGHGNGPHRGSLLLGRVLTDTVIAGIGEQAEVQLRMTPLPPERSRSAAAASTLATSIASAADTLEVSRSLTDLYGHPVLTLQFELPRLITQRGQETLSFALVSLAIAGLVVVLALLVTLRRLVLMPVQTIEQFAAGIATSDDLSQRLPGTRGDELGRLARQLNLMVGRLAVARREVVDKSFEAGLAEMARGVLHNIGNALTPVLVGAGALQRSVSALPAADLDMVSAELDRPELDPTRRADLQQFLRGTSARLSRQSSEIAQDVRALVEGVQSIQAILHQQSQFARTAQLVESVALPDLVSQALRLVPPVRLKQLDIEVDDSLAAVGPQRLARIAMEQVIQNLILNACEAVQPGQRGTLRIRAAIETHDARPTLHLVFADDGVGIAPENLPRMFGKGFSTKSTDTNSGLGLHWSANVVQAMQGSLRVDSAGPGRGATFHLRLPVAARVADTFDQEIAA